MCASDSSETALVAAVRRGDRAAFGVVVARHRPMALHLCQQVLRDWSCAEDAVQEAVLQAWLSLGKLREPERFGAWLAGIALHVCQSWLRYQADRTWSLETLPGGRLVPEPVDLVASPPECAELRDLQRRVRQAVAALPAGQRTAVTLFYLADLSHAEIAALLGIPSGAVKSRLHKGRDRLRRTLLELWLEEHMTNQTISDFIDVQVADVRAVPVDDPPGERRVVLLAERDGERMLPIWVGGFEGDSIAIGLVHARHGDRSLSPSPTSCSRRQELGCERSASRGW